MGGDQPLDETMPLKFLKQLCGRKPNIFIRYRERGDMDCDYVRVYPGILKYESFVNYQLRNLFVCLLIELTIILK